MKRGRNFNLTFLVILVMAMSATAGSIKFHSIYLDFTNSGLMRNIAMTFQLEATLPSNMMMRVVSPIQLHTDDLLTMPQFIVKERSTICGAQSIQEYLSFGYRSFGWQSTDVVLKSTTVITATVIRSTLTADTGKFAYFLWFSGELTAGMKYTMVIITAKQFIAPQQNIMDIVTDQSELDINQDFLSRTRTLSAGYFEISTVSSYLVDYMTYDSNPMFAELLVTPAAIPFLNFATFPEKLSENLGVTMEHKLIFEPRYNHTGGTNIIIYLSNSKFLFKNAEKCTMKNGFHQVEGSLEFTDLKCVISGNSLRITSTTQIKVLNEYSISFEVENPMIVAKSDIKIVTLGRGAHTVYHVQTATDAIEVHPISLTTYDMLLAWGLTRNPAAVKIYRANSNNEAVYNGITFRFSLDQAISVNGKVELLLDDNANVLCGSLTHTLAKQTGKTQLQTCVCSDTSPKKIVCEVGPLAQTHDYDIRIKIGWSYDAGTADVATAFGDLVIFPYDSVLVDYSPSSIIIAGIPTGSRTTVNNLQLFKSTSGTFGNYLVSSKQNPDLDYANTGYGLHISETPQHIDFAIDTAATDFGGATSTASGSSSGFIIYTSAGFAESSISQHQLSTDFCTVQETTGAAQQINTKTSVCNVENVPSTDFGAQLTRFKYGFLDVASAGADVTFWNQGERLFGFFGVTIKKGSSLYVEQSMGDFYLETYSQGLTDTETYSQYLVKTQMINAYTISSISNLLDFEIFISNFWASDTGTTGSNYEVTGEKFPTIVRVWGKLDITEVSSRVAVFFDYMKPFNGISSGMACNVTGEHTQKLTKCSGIDQTGPVFNADISQSHMIIYEFDDVLDEGKWFELIIPVSTISNQFIQSMGFAVLNQSVTQTEPGYYDVKELVVKRDMSYATTTNTLDLANNAALKGVNYKTWYDYDASRSYYNGKSENLTILLQHTDTATVFLPNTETDKGAGVVITFPETPLYNHVDFKITSSLAGWEPYEQCSAISYNYLQSTSPDVYVPMYGIFCPILNIITSSRQSLIHITSFEFPSVFGEHMNNIQYSISTKTGLIVQMVKKSNSLVLQQSEIKALTANGNDVVVPFLTAGISDQKLNLIFSTHNPIPVSGQIRITSKDGSSMQFKTQTSTLCEFRNKNLEIISYCTLKELFNGLTIFLTNTVIQEAQDFKITLSYVSVTSNPLQQQAVYVQSGVGSFNVDLSQTTVISYDKTPFIKTFTASAPSFDDLFPGALTQFTLNVKGDGIKLIPGQKIEINLQDFSDSATKFEYGGTPSCQVIEATTTKLYNFFSSCQIAKTANNFIATLLVGNFSSTSSVTYRTDTNGFNYGEISPTQFQFRVLVNKVIVPFQFRRDVDVMLKSTFGEIMFSTVIPMADVNALITEVGQEMEQNSTLLIKQKKHPRHLIKTIFQFISHEIQKSNTIQITFPYKYSPDLTTGHNLECLIQNAYYLYGVKPDVPVTCEIIRPYVMKVTIANSDFDLDSIFLNSVTQNLIVYWVMNPNVLWADLALDDNSFYITVRQSGVSTRFIKIQDVSHERDPSLPPAQYIMSNREVFFGMYEQVVGFNSLVYHEPTELELNFAISERAAPVTGSLIFDFSADLRKAYETTILYCENSINKNKCKYEGGRLIIDIGTVNNKTSYMFKIKGQTLPIVQDKCELDHLLPRATLESDDMVFSVGYGMPIFEGSLDFQLKDYKEYFIMSQPGIDSQDPRFGYLHKQFTQVQTLFDFKLNNKMYSPKIRFSLASGKRFTRNIGMEVRGFSLTTNRFMTQDIKLQPSDVPIRALLSEFYIDVYIGFDEALKQGIYNIMMRIQELPLRQGSTQMIPTKEGKYIPPDTFNIERNFQIVEICPMTKLVKIPHSVGSISMPIIFDISQSRPISSLDVQASFASEGNGLGFNKQGSKLTFDFMTGVQFLVVEKREVDFISMGKSQNVQFAVQGDAKKSVKVCEDVKVEIVDIPSANVGVTIELETIETTETTVKFTIQSSQQIYIYWHLEADIQIHVQQQTNSTGFLPQNTTNTTTPTASTNPTGKMYFSKTDNDTSMQIKQNFTKVTDILGFFEQYVNIQKGNLTKTITKHENLIGVWFYYNPGTKMTMEIKDLVINQKYKLEMTAINLAKIVKNTTVLNFRTKKPIQDLIKMNFRFSQTLTQSEIENYICYLVSELQTNPDQLKTMDNIKCIVGNDQKTNMLTGKFLSTGNENITLEVEYVIYDTQRALLERMKEMNNLKINQPTLQYYQNMISHKLEKWSVPKLSSFSKLSEVPYVSAQVLKKSNLETIGRYSITFQPIKLDTNGILNLYVLNTQGGTPNFDEFKKVADAVIIHSFYETKSFVSAEIFSEKAKNSQEFRIQLQKKIDETITSYIQMSYKLSQFESRILDREVAILDQELNVTFTQQIMLINQTISSSMQSSTQNAKDTYYNASIKSINNTINIKRQAEKKKIKITYLTDMVKNLQSQQDFIINGERFRIMNHFKIVMKNDTRSDFNLTLNNLIPSTEYVMYYYSTTETPDENVQKNNVTQIIAATRSLAMQKIDFYGKNVQQSAYKSGMSLRSQLFIMIFGILMFMI